QRFSPAFSYIQRQPAYCPVNRNIRRPDSLVWLSGHYPVGAGGRDVEGTPGHFRRPQGPGFGKGQAGGAGPHGTDAAGDHIGYPTGLVLQLYLWRKQSLSVMIKPRHGLMSPSPIKPSPNMNQRNNLLPKDF